MPIFLICVVLIITLAWGGWIFVDCDELMSGIIFFLADIGLFSAWLYVLINYVIPRFKGDIQRMKKQHFPNENGEITINGHRMSWIMKRCRTASAFGVRGSRIFYLELMKDGKTVCKFDHGWDISKKLNNEDEEAVLCVSYLVDKFGKGSPKKKKKEMGFQE